MRLLSLQSRSWVLLVLIAGWTGCQSTPTNPAPTNQAFIQGKAKVLEVSNELGYALLSIDGKSVYGYWTAERTVAQQTPMFTRNGPLEAPQGEAKEPKVIAQQFPAKVGDTIAFRGMKTGDEIYLTGVMLLSQ